MQRLTIIAALLSVTFSSGAAIPQEAIEVWSVTGVAADDVLHLRDVPSADSRSLARIPPHARGLKGLGCRRTTLGLEDWMHMTKSDRQGVQTLWCRVDYNGQQGWVAGRYLRRDGP